MNQMYEDICATEALHYKDKWLTAIEPMDCGHPGACMSDGGCAWCASLKAQPKRNYRKRGYEDILTQHQAECFADIWEAWPVKRDDGKPGRGDKFRAMDAFASACASGNTPEELVEAGARYLLSYEQDRGGYLQMVATFYGPMKRTYMTFMKEEA